VEIIIVIALIAIVMAIALPQFYRVYQNYRAQTAVERISINLRFARLAAVKKRVQYRVLVDDVNNTYTVEWDPQKDGSFETYAQLDTSMPDSTVDILGGGLSQIIYNPRGAADVAGTIRVSSPVATYRINVYTSGAVTKTIE
jgi:type II secretory pathway pseudopilin PulG